MTLPVLPTTVVGSYPQPDWLVDRALLSKGVPRVRQQAIWRIPEPLLEQAQDDATIVAIREIERAGIDIVSDGEIRRESYSNRFATALDGVDIAQPALITDRYGNQTAVPRVVGRVRRTRPVELRDMQFLRRHTDHPAKITLPGPFTMTQQARNEFYRDVESLAMDFAAADFVPAAERCPTIAGFAAFAAAATPRLGVLGFGTVGRVVVVVRTVAVPVFRAAVVALVGAFLAAAIRVFLLANDCGLVSAWRLRIPAWTQGVGAGASFPPRSSGHPRHPTRHCASRRSRVPASLRQPWRRGRAGTGRDIGRRRSRRGCHGGTRNSRPRQAHCRSCNHCAPQTDHPPPIRVKSPRFPHWI